MNTLMLDEVKHNFLKKRDKNLKLTTKSRHFLCLLFTSNFIKFIFLFYDLYLLIQMSQIKDEVWLDDF